MNDRSILIVEDEAIVALDLKHQLEELGYTVHAIAPSAERAIEIVNERQPHLILMDVRLQGQLDGIEGAAIIRRNHNVPVIFLTSHSDNDTVRRAAGTSPYGYLTKPYQMRELRAGIEVAMTKAAMERQLREADRWFVHTLQCVADGVIVTDMDERVRFLNPAAQRLTGWPTEEAAGRGIDEIVHLRDLRDLRDEGDVPTAALDAAASQSASESLRWVLRHSRAQSVAHGVEMEDRDGMSHVIDRTAGPVNDELGHPMGAVLVLRDASQRIAQEALLRSSEERFRSAFDHAPLGMALVSLAGNFILLNLALCNLLGATDSEIKRLGHHGVTLPADAAHEAQRVAELVAESASLVQFEKRYIRPHGGEPVWTLVSVSLMHEQGNPTCYLYQVHDLTQQKIAAEQLAELTQERMRREASEMANVAKNQFLSRVSHEMRTPLNAVIGFAQLLSLAQNDDPASVELYARHISNAGKHMLTLVSDLLDVNNASQGTLKLDLQALPLKSAAGEVLELLRSLASAHSVTISAEVAATLTVLADATRLRQVLLNLVSNAIKYNKSGGRIDLHGESASAGRVRLIVTDSGAGMTSEQLAKLFQPFERLGQERGAIEGTGLGLVISRSLTQEMHGTLEVSSAPGVGTAVTIELPSGNAAAAG